MFIIMQCVDNKMRKKIRKTRKTLNEIRKGTNRFQNISSIKNNKKYNNKIDCSNAQAPVYITTNRLTLLHKTIRSETIARSTCTSHANVEDIVETRESVKKYDLNSEEKFKCNSNEGTILILSTSDKETNWDIENSLDLLSPLHHVDYDKCARDSLNPASESPPALHLQSDPNKYGLLTNSILECLSEQVPLLLNTDIIEKDKSDLRHMYLESDDDDFTCTNGIISPKATKHTDSSREVSSPEIRRSSQSPLSSPGLSMGSALSDSPEYCYYPHRLNQSPQPH